MSTGADVLPSLAGTLVDRRDLARTRSSVLEGLFGTPPEPTCIGRFELLGTVGSGAMGRVYAAHDPRLGRRVALKLLRPDIAAGPLAAARRRRLVAEAQALARLSHPNVVEVFEVGTEGAEVYVVMELVDGASLRDWLREEQPDPPAIVAAFVAAGRGLAAAHAAGIVHRDFKPDNVLVGHDGRVRVADFGVAIASASDASAGSPASPSPHASQTTRGAAGTPGYVAPEVVHDGFADARSDQFSFCVSLVEALTGKRPQGAEDAPALPLPPQAAAAVRRGLQLEPKQRLDSMSRLADVLEGQTPNRRRFYFIVGGLALVPVFGAFAAWQPQPTEARCGSADSLVAPVWNEPRRESLEASLQREQPELGRQTWERAEPRIDAYVAAVTQRRRTACEHGTNSAALTAANDCAAARLSDLDVVLALFERGEAEPQHLIAALDRLGDSTGCDEASHVPGQAALQAELAHAQALSTAGGERGMVLARDIRRRAADLGDPRTVVEADLVLGIAEANHGSSKSDPERLRNAYFAANELGDPALATRAAIALGYHASLHRSDGEDAQAWVEHANTQIQRTEDPRRRRALEVHLAALQAKLALDARDAATGLTYVEQALAAARRNPATKAGIEARLLRMQAQAQHRLGSTDAALRTLDAAHGALEEEFGAGHPMSLSALSDVATMLFQASRYDQAHTRALQVAAGFEAAYGPDNPRLGTTLTLIGAIEGAMGEYDSARESLLRASEILMMQFGEEHHRVALNYLNLSATELALGDLESALRHREKAVAIEGRLYGEDSPRMASLYNAMGQLYSNTEDATQAVPWHERALAVSAGSDAAPEGRISALLGLARALGQEDLDAAIGHLETALPLIAEATGTQSEDYATALTNIAVLYVNADRPADALTAARQAIELYELLHGPNDNRASYAMLAAADAAAAHGAADDAIAYAQRAVEIRRSHDEVPDYLVARAQLVLVRALWRDHARRPDSLTLADTVRATLQAAGKDGIPGLEELQEWETSR